MIKKLIAITLSLFAMTIAGHAGDMMSVADKLKAELAEVGPSKFVAHDYKPGTIRHIVLFRFKEGTTDAERQEVIKRFTALMTKSRRDGKPYIVSIEVGLQASGEGADHGLEQGYIVTFDSEGDRNYYVGTPIITDPEYYDPDHNDFKEFVIPYLSSESVVFDFAVDDMMN